MTIALQRPAAAPTSGGLFHCWIGSLAALGYPPCWVMRRAGHLALTDDVTRGETPSDDVIDDVQQVWLDYRDQPAEQATGTGLTSALIEQARAYAARHEYFTPDWYDEYGREIGIMEHKRRAMVCNKRERAYANVEVIRLILNGLTDKQIAARTSRNERDMPRFRKRVGVEGYFEDGVWWFPTRESRPRCREIERALNAYYRRPGADPHVLLVELGITDDPRLDQYLKVAS